ncbi:MAG TPA: ParB/RepB/Spo0J family partition protein [Gemmatimonadaceae bacterium]|nr:ParB/RepB/Spo0J family partition protein [Gemmatimonadaceae bacterium]
MSTDKPRRLGRGLEALLASRPGAAGAAGAESANRQSLQRIAVSQIHPNPYQPRTEFKPGELAELEGSLRVNGLLQPIVVRSRPSGDGYELIAGERRLRAATKIGWEDIPAVVKEIDDRMLLTLALVENLQRSNLNPIEEALGYQRLISDFTLTQQQVAEVVGKDRTTVANILRLLALPDNVRRILQDGHITLGHARALLAVSDEREQTTLANEIVAHGLTVRDVEERARGGQAARNRPRSRRGTAKAEPPAALRRASDELRRLLQTDVSISQRDSGRGAIEIVFYSADDLDRLLDLLLGSSRDAM